MRRSGWLLLLVASTSMANIEPETIGTSTMAKPASTWLMVHGALGPAYIFDTATGDMQGLLSLSRFTPAVETRIDAGELYAAESFYSRGPRGERTDLLTIYDMATLAPVGEVELPQKIAALGFLQYIELLDDQRHVAVYNMTPAASVSLVDVEDREFASEISTPGCALIMGTANRGFLQICGDGSLQLIRVDANGDESQRVRSRKFFSIEDDPVFDKPVQTPEGWLLTSYQGQVFDVTVDGDDINISEPWSLLTDDDKADKWSPGGGQFIAYHESQDLLFVLVNADGEFSHDSAGSEVWIFDRSAERRIGRLPLEHPGTNLFVSQNDAPLLTVTGDDMQLYVFDVETLTLVRTISEVGWAPGLLQGF